MAQKRESEEEISKTAAPAGFASSEGSPEMSQCPPTGREESRREVNRCSGCNRRIGLMGFRCRCGNLFCSEHRYSDRHDCGFDYKAAGRAAIARDNPVVRPAKILKV
ncbi:zinc finger A20 and AN1 domain-containing stress-associated protein 5-like [Malania oleifera]|uniref:zinc finger A20 and AN1 domain-containing stress-associated protein 5-like n=1 Tax=Malania oleifera TaxID=397392 RepID=UPI0025AE8C6A|nr:zinc finger A20 and AN1 domain-containing stress-associated protein 5-like [Malania oleifera]